MKKLIALLAVTFAASMANAQAWKTTSVEFVANTATRTTYRYEFTAATNSTGIDISALKGNTIEATFDPSTGDASTDATIDIRSCTVQATIWQDCTSIATTFNPDGTTFASISVTSPGIVALLVKVNSAPTGGDTARVEIRGESVAARNNIQSLTPVAYPLGVALTAGDCTGRVITNLGATQVRTWTLPTNPAPGLICNFSAQSSQRMIIEVQGASGCALGAACDLVVSHTRTNGEPVGSPIFTTFGDAIECVSVDADTWLCRNIQGFWEDNS